MNCCNSKTAGDCFCSFFLVALTPFRPPPEYNSRGCWKCQYYFALGNRQTMTEEQQVFAGWIYANSNKICNCKTTRRPLRSHLALKCKCDKFLHEIVQVNSIIVQALDMTSMFWFLPDILTFIMLNFVYNRICSSFCANNLPTYLLHLN